MKVFIIAAITIDGYIAKDSNHLADWTTPEDKQLFVKLTKEAGVIVMGSKTFKTIGRALPDRKMIVMTTKPKVAEFKDLEYTNESPKEIIDRMSNEKASGVAICGGESVYSQFMESGLVDELYITVEPVVFGTGVPLFSRPMSFNLELIESKMLNKNSVLLHYKKVV